MILLFAIVVGLAATFVRAKINHQSLRLRKLSWEWLVFVAVIPQILVFQIPAISRLVPESLVPFIQIISMLGLLVFVARNFLVPGFWALGFGLLSNFLVIFMNGGWMPVSPQTLFRLAPSKPESIWEIGTRLGYSKDYIMAVEDTKLVWFSDVLTLPQWFPYKFAFSVGDILISIGTLILLWSLSNKNGDKK